MDNNVDTKMPHKKSSVLHKRKLLIILSIIFLTVAVIGVCYLFLWRGASISSENSGKVETPRTQYTPEEIAEQKALSEKLAIGENMSANGDRSGAIKYYNDLAAQANISYEKSRYILAEACIYFEEKDFSKAIEFAKQAESVDDNFVVAGLLGQIYEESGDKANAIKSYQHAINLVDKSDPMANIYIADYRAFIKSLGGGA